MRSRTCARASIARPTMSRSTRRSWSRRWCDDGQVLTQSMAIMEYLDETHPKPPLLPKDPVGRARVRALR